MSKETMLKASRLLKKYGIRSGILNIVGILGESLSECLETLDFTIQCRPDFTSTSLLYPYPGTEIHEIARKMRLLPETEIHFKETYYIHSPLNLPYKKKIENLQKLLPITVEFPRMRCLTLLLIKLPLGGLYNLIRRLHKGFCLRYKIFYYKLSLKEYISLVWRFLASKAG